MSNATSLIPFWGQAYELIIKYAAADGSIKTETITTNSWEPEALRITFDVLQSTLPSPWWFADITIYNLNVPELQNIILNATWATLKAGFQTGVARSSIIWDGPILQTLLDQEEVVDIRATLHCVANPLVMDDILSFSVGKYASQLQVVAKMAAKIGLPPMSTTNGTVSSYAAQQLQTKQYLRGNTIFGKMGKHLSQIADDQFMTTFRNGAQAYITELSQGQTTPTPSLIYAPPDPPNTLTSTLPPNTTQTIIGTPKQTAEGVIFTVLLDPRLIVGVPPLVVRLVNTLISQVALQPGEQYVTPLVADLTFFVGQVRHIGDSRGNDWYTEVTGYSTVYAAQLLNGVFSATTGGV